jgi:hypothetical protein
MLDLINTISNLLMLFFFWIGIPSLLISMLCILGFQYKGKPILILSLIGFIALACFCLSVNIAGLISGETLSISKFGPTMVNKHDNQLNYWVATTLWFCGSLFLLVFCMKKLLALIFQHKNEIEYQSKP